MKAGLLAILLVFAVHVRAQYIGSNTYMVPVSFNYDGVERSGNAMTINYDQSDEVVFGANYQRALFPIHRGYDTIAGQNIVYALYTLDSLIKTDNSYILPFANVNGLMLDSIDLELGHVMHSAGNDTLILTLLQLDTVNFPNGPIQLVDTIILSSAQSPGNVLTNTIALRWKPNFIMNDQPIGLKIEFTGSLLDTLALQSGYGIWPAPNGCTDSSWDKARKSFFYPNSYSYWSNFNLILPTNILGDLFYNCDTILTKDTADSESYIQNWSITSYVSAPEIGIEDENLLHLTIYPNPANNIIYLKGVDNMASVKAYSTSGALVKAFIHANYLDVTDLNNGIYIFAIEYENKTVHKKVVIRR